MDTIAAESYAKQLRDAKEDEGITVFVGDGHHAGTTVFRRGDTWWLVDHENHQLKVADALAVVVPSADGDPDHGLNQVTLACDLECLHGVWIVDAEDAQGWQDWVEAVI
jgi:hypothetical protein